MLNESLMTQPGVKDVKNVCTNFHWLHLRLLTRSEQCMAEWRKTRGARTAPGDGTCSSRKCRQGTPQDGTNDATSPDADIVQRAMASEGCQEAEPNASHDNKPTRAKTKCHKALHRNAATAAG